MDANLIAALAYAIAIVSTAIAFVLWAIDVKPLSLEESTKLWDECFDDLVEMFEAPGEDDDR